VIAKLGNNGVILLIESDAYTNNANRCIFETQQYTVHTATSFTQARSLLKETKPDIIIMETIMPDGDGFDFCVEIHGMTQANIIFLTFKSEDIDMKKGLKSGGDIYITKPADRDEMVAWVDAIMRRRSCWDT